MDTTELDKAKYVSLTSYKTDGTAVSLPIWLEGDGGTYDMMTQDGSYKVKRIRKNPNVQLQVSNMRGDVSDGAPVFEGTAEIIAGAEADAIQKKVRAKYGVMGWMMTKPRMLFDKVTRKAVPDNVGIRVTISG